MLVRRAYDEEDEAMIRESVDAEALMKARTMQYMASHPSGLSLTESLKTTQDAKELFEIENIPTYYPSAADKMFQRVKIDEVDDEEEGEIDALEASVKILRALDLHDEWTRFKKVDHGPKIAPTSPKGSRGPSYRRGIPVYDPFSKFEEAKRETRWDLHLLRDDAVYRVVTPPPAPPPPPPQDGQMQLPLRMSSWEDASTCEIPSLKDFASAFCEIRAIINSGPVKTLAYTRLAVLEELFNLHVLLNGHRELRLQKSVPHRDFYNVRKVDTHVHHSACMNQKHLLRFIKAKLRKHPDELVTVRDGTALTLEGVFKSLRLTAYDLSIDTLDMHAHDTFHRFDRFNLKYNPAGQSRLREIFLKTDNYVKGRYLAEITKEVISDLEASKYQFAEWRVSIYGRNRDEWARLADWFFEHKLSSPNVRWMIQIPRLYSIYKKTKTVTSFGQVLTNIFEPLFEVTLNPASNPRLHCLLEAIVGFDSVDDESKPDFSGSLNPSDLPDLPDEWTHDQEPSYPYWMYYLYANLRSLNALRARRKFSTFEFRPHCGEAGDVSHLVAAFLTTTKINHGIQLRRSPAMQYLYYLSKIGIAMSPLSNNRLFLDFNKNPFPKYFKRGLNVSLSTDDPLMLHVTKDPLVEEYSVAQQVWKLSSTDVCEIARNSVLQSGIEHRYKRHYLGDDYDKPQGNDIRMTNVPDIRVAFRYETHQAELSTLRRHARAHAIVVARPRPLSPRPV